MERMGQMLGETQMALYCLSCVSADPSNLPVVVTTLLTMPFAGVSDFACDTHREHMVRFRVSNGAASGTKRNDAAVARLLGGLKGLSPKEARRLLGEVFPTREDGHK